MTVRRVQIHANRCGRLHTRTHTYTHTHSHTHTQTHTHARAHTHTHTHSLSVSLSLSLSHTCTHTHTQTHTNRSMKIITGDFPVHREKMQGYVVGVRGSKVGCTFMYMYIHAYMRACVPTYVCVCTLSSFLLLCITSNFVCASSLIKMGGR